MFNWLKSKFKDARGSVLIISLVLVVVMTILGLSLFELGLLESRLLLATVCDQQAYETAQAGIKRSLRLLRLDLTNDPNDPSWADGDPASVTTTFAAFPGLTDQSFADGTYSVELKNLTRSEANGIGAACDADNDPAQTCKDLIYVRATGNCSRGTATSTKTTQLVVRAKNNAPFAGGIVVGGPPLGGSVISGNALIAGSLHLACTLPPCTDVVSFGGNAGLKNNYNDMPSNLQDRIPLLQLVTCPDGTPCAGQQVESLGAVVQIAEPQTTTAIYLSGSATLGESSASHNPYTGKLGKPYLDDVRIGDGCDIPDCSDTVGGKPVATNVFSDNPIKPYGTDTPAPFPRLDDEVTINGITYAAFAACPSTGNCDAGATNDFFISHGFKILPGTLEDGTGCEGADDDDDDDASPPCNRDLHTLLTTGSGLTNSTNSFTKTFVCAGQCNDSSGNRVNGSVNGSQPSAFKIEWKRSNQEDDDDEGEENEEQDGQLLTIYQCTGATCDPGPPDANWEPLSHPTQTVLPLLVYVDGPLIICDGCNNKTILYQGHATFLARGDIVISASLLTYCPTCPDDPDHSSFPQKNLLSFLTPGDISVGLKPQQEQMGLFYAGNQWSTAKQTIVVGAVTAKFFDMGTNVPRFFQVPALNATMSETVVAVSGSRWSVAASNWKECLGTLTQDPC